MSAAAATSVPRLLAEALLPTPGLLLLLDNRTDGDLLDRDAVVALACFVTLFSLTSKSASATRYPGGLAAKVVVDELLEMGGTVALLTVGEAVVTLGVRPPLETELPGLAAP